MLKRIMVFWGVTVLLSTLASGCFWSESIGTKLDNEAKEDLIASIKFEFDCSQEEITLTCLKKKDWGNEACQKWEFKACGHTGVFIINFNANTGVFTWILNSHSKL